MFYPLCLKCRHWHPDGPMYPNGEPVTCPPPNGYQCTAVRLQWRDPIAAGDPCGSLGRSSSAFVAQGTQSDEQTDY